MNMWIMRGMVRRKVEREGETGDGHGWREGDRGIYGEIEEHRK